MPPGRSSELGSGSRVIAEQRGPEGGHVVLAFEREWASNTTRLLHPVEHAYAARFGPVRRDTWAAGRTALRVALSASGLRVAGPVLPNGRGAPNLGPGLCGSISHKRWLVAAAVRYNGGTVGIDVETLETPRWRIARRVLTPQELDAVWSLPEGERWQAIVLRFSLKEAVYKAADPWIEEQLGFKDVSVQPLSNGDVAVGHTLAVAGSLSRSARAGP